jgi:hypothetical protein
MVRIKTTKQRDYSSYTENNVIRITRKPVVDVRPIYA